MAMNRTLVAGALALAVASPALAADLPPASAPRAPAAYVPAVAPIYNWNGIYVGINGGYGFGNSNWNADPTIPFPGTGDFNISGGLVGGTIGANFQTGPFVFGIEADGDWSDIKGNVSGTPATCGAGFTCSFQTSNEWMATIRGRIGYAFSRVLVYGTGGGAAGDVKAQLTTTAAGGSLSTDTTEFGWAAGAGIEVAVTDNLTAKVEYLFVDLSNGSLSCSVATCGVATNVPVSFDASLVRGGLNYKFNF